MAIKIVVFEFQSGPHCGLRFWLRPGQTMTIGRSDLADLALERDGLLSRVHLGIECKDNLCSVGDLASTNGVTVNGQKIQQAVLHDGDSICAGQGTILVRIETEASPGVSSPSQKTLDAIQTTPPGEPRPEIESPPSVKRPAPAEPTPPKLSPGFGGPQPKASSPSTPISPYPAENALQRVVISIRTGPMEGHRQWLRPGESLTVGRESTSDLTVSGDQRMSSQHFCLESDGNCCRLRDLKSRNGTILNGDRIADATLCDGDVVMAGSTEFAIQILGGVQEVKRTIEFVPGSFRGDLAQALASVDLPPLAEPCTYSEYPCSSGLRLFRGCQSRFDPATVPSRIAHVAPIYFVSGISPPDGASNEMKQQALLSPADTSKQDDSLWILGPAAPDDCGEAVQAAWSKDALVCIVSSKRNALVREQLRQFAETNLANPATKDLVYFRPTVVAEFLANSEAAAITEFMHGFDAVYMEVHGGDRWALFAPHGFNRLLDKLGISPAPEWAS